VTLRDFENGYWRIRMRFPDYLALGAAGIALAYIKVSLRGGR
jgi:hypothetical protein